jgi:PAP2 superfamily
MPPRSRWWVELLVIGWLLWVYDAITNLQPLRMAAALDHARSIHNLEQSLGIAPEHSLNTWLAAHPSLALALSDYYDNAHFIVTVGLLVWLWWARPDIYRGLRNSLVLINVLAFIVFWRYPVAPPRMLGGFTDVVASTHAIGSWHSGALASQANQFAAMPSLHIGWAVWCSVAIWKATDRAWIRALGIVYPFVTAFAVLATGNHFLFDILGGLLVAAASFAIVSLASRRRAVTTAVPA